MFRFQWLGTLTLLAGTALWMGTLAGCAEREATRPDPQVRDQAPHDHDHPHRPGEYAEALAALSPEDRALAERQRICPVSGEPLGSMGTPVKVTVEGRDVLLCCEGCRPAIEADPEKYLEKLPE